MSILGERFYKMSNAIFCYDLTPIQLAVYSYLVCCTGSKGRCWPASSQAPYRSFPRKREKSLAPLLLLFPANPLRWALPEDGERRQTNNTYYIHDLPPLGTKPQPKIVEAGDDDERNTA